MVESQHTLHASDAVGVARLLHDAEAIINNRTAVRDRKQSAAVLSPSVLPSSDAALPPDSIDVALPKLKRESVTSSLCVFPVFMLIK